MDTDRLRQRLSQMPNEQLRARWKRIDERLEPGLISLGEKALALEDLAGLEELPLAYHEGLSVLRRELEELDCLASDDPTAAAAIESRHRELALALLSDEAPERAALREPLLADCPELERWSELASQRGLVAAELKSRGEELPALDGEAVQQSMPRVSRADVDRQMERAGELVGRVGEGVGKVGKAAGSALGEATKKAAGSAMKASGRAVWGLATSAFTYKKTGEQVTAPSAPVRGRRRRRRRNDADETLDLLERLHSLKEAGILDEEEFAQKKAELLERL